MEKTLLRSLAKSFTQGSALRGVASFCESGAIPLSIRIDFIHFIQQRMSKIAIYNQKIFSYIMDNMSYEDANRYWLQYIIYLKEKILSEDN